MLKPPEGNPTLGLPRALGAPLGKGRLKVEPEDFRVFEKLGEQPTGEGEYVLLRIRKRRLNTDTVARRLAEFAQVRRSQVGYAGRKDKHAVTTQSFSVKTGADLEWSELEDDNLEVLSNARHRWGLKTGALLGNSFAIRVRDCTGLSKSALETRLSRIRKIGVPNYFGPQRFGRDGANLRHAAELFSEAARRFKQTQSIYLSAARSWLFNMVLGMRVTDCTWNVALDGELLLRNGSGSEQRIGWVTPQIAEDVIAMRLHPSGPLPGGPRRGMSPAGAALAQEQLALAGQNDWMLALARSSVASGRRPLRAPVYDLQAALVEGDLMLNFSLPAGAYATSLVREILSVD